MCADAVDLSDGPGAALIAAGRRLVATRGPDFTVHELVDEASVALQTFYRYFGGRNHFLAALISDQIRGHCDRLLVALQDEPDPVERLRVCVRATFAPMQSEQEVARARFIATEHWRLHPLLPDEITSATQPFTDLIAAQLEAGRDAGLLRPRDVDHDASFITMTVMSAVHHFVFAPSRPLGRIAEDLCEFCVAAVGGDADDAGATPASARAPVRPRARTRARGARPGSARGA